MPTSDQVTGFLMKPQTKTHGSRFRLRRTRYRLVWSELRSVTDPSALGAFLLAAAVLVFLDSASVSASTGLPVAAELPSSAAAVVFNPAVGLETITTRSFERALAQAAPQAHLKRPPRPGQMGYEKLKEAAMENLLAEKWIPDQATEMGISVTQKQVAAASAQFRKGGFKSTAEYKRFLRAYHLTQSDVNLDVKVQMLGTDIELRVFSGTNGSQAEGKRAFARFKAEYLQRWRSRTVCAPAYVVVERCSNGS
jgi:hypothetical protein